MIRSARTWLFLALTLLTAIPGVGCSAPATSPSFLIPAGRYDAALVAVREELRDSGYSIERVDSTAGEITTAKKTVAGIATPLASENRTIRGVLADTLSGRPRTVRVRFRDAGDPLAPPRPDADVRAEVDAVIWRRIFPGWRIETETTVGNQTSRDPSLAARGVSAASPMPVRRDEEFAGVLAQRMADRLAALPKE